MSFASYMRSNVGEFLLVLLSVWAMGTVGVDAFFLFSISDAIGYAGRAALVLVLSAVLVCVLYAVSLRRRNLAAGIVVYVVLVAVFVGVALACSTGESLYEDVEGNYLYFVLVIIACSTAGFALTRTLSGSVVWLVAVAFACSTVQAFYESEELLMSVLAASTALMLVVHRNFRLGLERADMDAGLSHARNFGVSVVSVASVAALALVVWFAIIAPLNPGVLDIKLITDYRRLPIEEYEGVLDEKPTFAYDLTSENLVDGFEYTTDDLVEDPTSSVEVDAYSVLEQQEQQETTGADQADDAGSGGGTHDALDENSLEETYDAVSYSTVFPWIVLVILAAVLLVAAIVGYFVGRRLWRTRRLRRILALPPRNQVEQLYLFLIGRLRRIGFNPAQGATLSEFAMASAQQMDIVTETTHVSFARLTGVYTAVVYGAKEPTEDDIVPFVAYYQGFWKAARAELGTVRYFFKSFRL